MSSAPAFARTGALWSDARARVLRQHAAIRVLLWSAALVADAAAEGHANPRAQLVSLVAELRRVLEDHLSCEEALLIPILENEVGDDRLEARRFAQEHARQRADLATLTTLAAAGDFAPLASELSRFFTNLTVDMDYEEKTLLPDDIADTRVPSEPSAG